MFLKASCSMKFRLGSLWKALKIEKATLEILQKNWGNAWNKVKQKSNFGILKLCGHDASSKLSQGKCFRFNRGRNGKTRQEGSTQTAKPIKNIDSDSERKQKCRDARIFSFFFFLINKWTQPLCLNGNLTWNDRNSFQCSENPERSERRDISKVHKLCNISATR